MFQVAAPAPDFELKGIYKDEEKLYRVSDYRGRYLMLFFYYENGTSVCHSEIDELERLHHQFGEQGTDVLAISKSSLTNHRGWLAELGGLSFPLLSDPDGSVAARYGVLSPVDIGLLRGTFIIDDGGQLLSAAVGMPKVGRNIAEILRTLSALKSGEACEVGWRPKGSVA